MCRRYIEKILVSNKIFRSGVIINYVYSFGGSCDIFLGTGEVFVTSKISLISSWYCGGFFWVNQQKNSR
jgi:hypothetical protein